MSWNRVVLCIFLSIFSLGVSSSANAHVEIIDSFPAQYSNVNPIPRQVWIEFNGQLQSLDGEAINSLEVIDSTGLAINVGDAVLEVGKISTRLSGQSAPGVFTVKYRVVGDDGHVIEGEYTFNASPDYSESQSPAPTPVSSDSENVSPGGLILAGLLVISIIGYVLRLRIGKRS